MTDERREEIDRWCREHQVACAYFLAAGHDPATTSAAERGGFFYTDTRVTLALKLPARGRSRADPRVRAVRAADRDRLRAIARVSHKTTRFYHDPHLPDDRCGELYAHWIDASCDGGADSVFVVEAGGEVAGYVTCEIENEAVGHIGLIAVAPDHRGVGLGAALLDAALGSFVTAGVTESAVVTQERNTPALRLFQRSGYAVESSELWFHKWYDR